MPDNHSFELTALLRKQHGLLTLEQAMARGLTSSVVLRRVAAGRWQRVLPRVYLTAALELTETQRVWAAVLYAGEGAALTGLTALRQHRIKRLPDGPPTPTVFVVDGVRTMRVPRATVDAAARLTAYEPTLALLTAVIHSGKVSLSGVADELATAPNAGTRWLRKAVAEASLGARSVAEPFARQLFAAAGFPPPHINEPIDVNGQIFEPNLRWGRVIVEVDSKEWHLLHPGSWEATLHRRMLLTDGGYHVIPMSPSQLRDTPDLVLSVVRAALVAYLGWSA